jgi:hypothetical protein
VVTIEQRINATCMGPSIARIPNRKTDPPISTVRVTSGTIASTFGLIVSVLGAYLAWSLICAEVLFSAARTEDMHVHAASATLHAMMAPNGPVALPKTLPN